MILHYTYWWHCNSKVDYATNYSHICGWKPENNFEWQSCGIFSLLHQRADDEVLTLQGSARPLCFWSFHQSWSSRCFSLSGFPWQCTFRSSSASFHFSFTCPVRTALAQTRFFATIGTYLWNALHSSLCLTLMSGSRSASLSLLKTYFYSRGLRTESATWWSLPWYI